MGCACTWWRGRRGRRGSYEGRRREAPSDALCQRDVRSSSEWSLSVANERRLQTVAECAAERGRRDGPTRAKI